MQIARSFSALNNSQSEVALTIGSFDGVHPGHKHLFSYMENLAPIRLVVTFETLPINYFRKEPIPQLTTLEQKLLLLEESGIDIVLLLPFDEKTALLTYQEFLQNIYDNCLFSHLVLGKGAAFGKDQLGNEQNIITFSKQLPFTPHYIKKLQKNGVPHSSMRLRQALNS
ncbi:MAG: hypothetical protein ChlgKO_12060 [Chlamydiales bacterium]